MKASVKVYLVGLGVGFTALSAQAALEEIVVTAQRRAESLQEVPIAVSAFETDAISKLQIDMTQDIGQNVPNLQTYDVTASGTAMQVHARGASIQNPGFNTSESPVGIYVDDVYRGRLATANFDLADVERIEVLRGPQATLYGRNTIAGAIKVISRTPGNDPYLNVSAGYGNYETSKITAAGGMPFIEDTLAGSLSVLYADRGEGFMNNPTTGQEPGEYTNQMARGKLHFYPGDKLDIVFSAWVADLENDGYNGVPYFDINTGSNVAPLTGFYDNHSPEGWNYGNSDQAGGELAVSYDFSAGLTLRSISAYSDIDDDFGFDLAGGGIANVPGIPGAKIDSSSEFKQFSQEFQLLGKSFGDAVKWVAGVYYLNEDGSQLYSGFADDPFDAFPPFLDFNENVTSETESFAVYGEATWQFVEKWSATAGLRWTEDTKDYTNVCTGDVASTCFGGPLDFHETWNEWTPKVALNYQMTDNVLMYLSAAKGFQAGGFQTLCFGNLSPSCAGIAYDPQDVWSYEYGVKTDLLDDTLRMNTVVFYADYSDLQQTVPTGPSFPTQNVGDAEVWGIEFESVWSPVDPLNMFVQFGWMDDEYSNLNPNSGAALAGAESLPSAPDFTSKLGADYTWGLGSLDLSFGADWYYSDDYYTDATNILEVPSFSRFNGFISLGASEGLWRVALTGKNLTDEDDYVSGLVVPGFTNVRTVAAPREIMLTASISL